MVTERFNTVCPKCSGRVSLVQEVQGTKNILVGVDCPKCGRIEPKDIAEGFGMLRDQVRVQNHSRTDTLTDDSPMPFGVHRGKPLRDVPAKYLDWLIGQRWLSKSHPNLHEYITRNLDDIHKEIED